jgi:hypothetical protein
MSKNSLHIVGYRCLVHPEGGVIPMSAYVDPCPHDVPVWNDGLEGDRNDFSDDFDYARSLLGEQVVVFLGENGGEKVLAKGKLLSIADSGEFAVQDDMGFVHYCWPMLSIKAGDDS